MQQGRSLVLIGHASHPEVEGTMGRIQGPIHLVETEADVETLALAPDSPVAYVSQTTLSVDETKSIIAALKRRFKDIAGPETKDICYATQNRQGAARELSKLVDVLLVVGARNSSNSTRLREIGAEANIPAFLIADQSELDCEVLRSARRRRSDGRRLGAPEILVEGVLDALRRLGPVELTTLPGVAEDIEFKLPAELNE